LFLALVVAFVAAEPGRSHAQQAVIEELIVTNTSSDLLLFLNVRNAFTAELENGVKNGVPVTFSFFVELRRKRGAWLDENLVSLTLEHTLTFDTLKEEYAVSRSEAEGSVVRTRSLPEAKRAMSQLNGVRVVPLGVLKADEEYRLRVKAKLAEKTLPLYFHYVIPFLSLWDFETDWHSLEFRY